MKSKITVIGAGNVGAQCAYRLAQRDFADIILLDIVEGVPQGKALDMAQSGSIEGFSSKIIGTNDYAEIKDSQVVVITAGLARKPGMSRDDLIHKNAEIISGIVKQVARHAPQAVLLMVTNPLDVMTYHALKVSGFPANRVLGMAPLLDAARMKHFISELAKVPANEIYAEVLGSHGDLMVPIPRLSTVKGRPLTELFSPEQVAQIVKRTTDGGAEIVSLLKTGSAYYAPGTAAAQMAEAIIRDSKQLFGACVLLSGEYGINDVCLGVPTRLGKKGIAEIVAIKLTDEELGALHKAAAAVKQLCTIL
ncbi:malate dehydrogenase [candidate division WOR-1 bacterium RIFOXYA12_FULL_52_29]|uniref:Malate dehydrogenase n=1 Tax=candidate division WOR-1 bacterium RIFOXYC12_FULL_54_18 TaxID=1802584 RepID=A0A1F4T7T5_UNCSA|nr:MAG: malate dehydrogenase [candidate division WOR-1 bacterium RIFOXYA2_FULL_51_19]OGC18183.1 MAG: malate dehydrogenase [candidate division WOR-1 bacterium RIFOXYA12_FULL_52_29]OGC27038.1 MAG: malate dehydrogenase [candidate division WOR-1 bacterium RIFOXYB2_FULL_45_9]OGC28600.1 MAG: malate dehydrogenase [candidate division WOR-1 bacterium RIFOXYC12_FULL_54_18]OGC30945.1 MAG: malate dehydrogenase [candidate division WOR-1 bacterium RIFOXYB12_FULL_52_16]